MIRGLLWCEFGEGRENPEGITGEEYYILRITCHGIGGPVLYGLYGIRPPGVLSERVVSEIWSSVCIKDNILQYRTLHSGSCKDRGLVLLGEVDKLGIASSFKVENSIF